jgi:hypothetical protein
MMQQKQQQQMQQMQQREAGDVESMESLPSYIPDQPNPPSDSPHVYGSFGPVGWADSSGSSQLSDETYRMRAERDWGLTVPSNGLSVPIPGHGMSMTMPPVHESDNRDTYVVSGTSRRPIITDIPSISEAARAASAAPSFFAPRDANALGTGH